MDVISFTAFAPFSVVRARRPPRGRAVKARRARFVTRGPGHGTVKIDVIGGKWHRVYQYKRGLGQTCTRTLNEADMSNPKTCAAVHRVHRHGG